MYVLQISRVDLLQFLPKGGVVAEIGVAEGGFSKKILNATSPQTLHLIDPWEFQDRDDRNTGKTPGSRLMWALSF